jgi:5-carboxymethyl-2-hydroxymuconate isomerase
MRDYTKIEAWKLADDLTALIFIHLSKRLGYVRDDKHTELESLFRRTFACLIGLTSAVEKETGKLGKAIAVITSAIVLGLARILPAPFGP